MEHHMRQAVMNMSSFGHSGIYFFFFFSFFSAEFRHHRVFAGLHLLLICSLLLVSQSRTIFLAIAVT